jgi:hypothetical protein
LTRCSWKLDIFKQQKISCTYRTHVYSSRHSTKTKQDTTIRMVSRNWRRSPLGCATCWTFGNFPDSRRTITDYMFRPNEAIPSHFWTHAKPFRSLMPTRAVTCKFRNHAKQEARLYSPQITGRRD